MSDIEVHQLWLQDKDSDGSVMLDKVKGECNFADALTNYFDGSHWAEDSDGNTQPHT